MTTDKYTTHSRLNASSALLAAEMLLGTTHAGYDLKHLTQANDEMEFSVRHGITRV